VFPSKSGAVLDAANLITTTYAVCRGRAASHSLHDLRHTFGSILINAAPRSRT